MLDVWEATHDNYQLRNEDVGFVTAPAVAAHRITDFVAYVDIAKSYYLVSAETGKCS